MNDNIINDFLNKYDLWIKENSDYDNTYQKLQKQLKIFLKKFTLEKIKDMPIDDYIVGKGKKDTFCYYVDYILRDLGGTKGQAVAYSRYGISFNKKLNDYQFKNKTTKNNKFGNNAEEVYNNVIKEVINLIQCTKTKKYSEIANNKLSPLFKHKLTYLYDSDNWIPIYSENDINILLTIFEIPFDINENCVYKRLKLFDFYKKLNRPNITTHGFMRFIYSYMGYREYLRDDVNNRILNYQKNTYNLVDIGNLSELQKNKLNNNAFIVNETYEKYSEKKLIGRIGENIVYKYLCEHKKDLGIIEGPTPYYLTDDSKHYDIEYKNKDNQIIYIEVKSTKLDNKNKIHFYMSLEEYIFMQNNKDNYYIYYLNDVMKGHIIYKISAKLLELEPIKYCCEMKIDKILS